ncbi:MAG: DUF937 domain-containing protein [Proteobacteria bacterium]|nr:DUF937 domain-containing protein [Pseudomonadota bacterium]
MGLLDGILGSVLSGMQGGSQGGFPGLPSGQQQPSAGSLGGLGSLAAAAPVLMAVFSMLQRSGGLNAVLQQLQQQGHGDQVQSWLQPGATNMPLDPGALQQMLGSGPLTEIAQKLGMSPQQAASSMAQALPHVVDQLTPAGAVPANHDDMVAQVLAELNAKRHGG